MINTNKPNLISIPMHAQIMKYFNATGTTSSDSDKGVDKSVDSDMIRSALESNVLSIMKSELGIGFPTCTTVVPSLGNHSIITSTSAGVGETSVFDLVSIVVYFV
mgnify:FL=1